MTNEEKLLKIKMENDPRKALSEAIDLIIQLLERLTESNSTKV